MRVPYRFAATLLAGALSLSLAIPAIAAPAQKGGQRQAGPIAAKILQKLSLTDDQQAKVKTATEAYQADVQKAQGLSTPKEKRQATSAARQTYESALKTVLNPDQQKLLQTMMDQAKEYRALGPVGQQLVGIELTAEQKDKIKAIGDKYQPELAKARAAQKDATDKAAARSEMQGIQQKMMEEVRGVLTPEQLKEMAPVRGKKNNANQ